ncbi:hypothetical protein SI35_06140 [Salmonella enterica]|nr:hypothetical protein [Salmonella enterica]EGG4133874.1 hypothetical protein [Salmonella enterica]
MKSLRCSLCGKIIEQSILFKHLANIHQWEEILKPTPTLSKSEISSTIQNKHLPKQTRCTKCNVLFDSKAAYKKHNKTCRLAANNTSIVKTISGSNTGSLRVCPYCNVLVSPKKFETHIRSKCPKQQMAQQSSKIDDKFYTDPAIEKYLAQHPEPPQMGKFGIPQAKFKYDTFGRRGMEYDTWSKS